MAKFIWMQPTRVSDPCRYELKVAATGRKLLSSCGMWETYYDAKRVLTVNEETQRPDGPCCMHCVSGNRVSNMLEPSKRRSWSGRRSPIEPYFPPTRL